VFVAVPSSGVSASTKIFVLLCANAIVMYIDRTNIAITAPIIQKELGLSNASLGSAFSAFSITYACCMVIGGRLSDAIGSRFGLVLCGVLWGIGTIATGLVGGLAALVMARLLVGTGESAVYPISSAVISRWIKADRRGSAQGILHGCGRLGAALAPAVVTALVLLHSWRWAFIVLGIASLVMTALIAFYLRDDPRLHPSITPGEVEALGHRADQIGRVEVVSSARLIWPEFLANVWPVTVISFCYGWFSWFLLSWIPLYFSHAHGLEIKSVAMFSTLVLIFGVLGMVGGGLATDLWLKHTGSVRRARRDVIVVSFIGALLCVVPLLVTTELITDTIALALGYFFIELADSSIWMLGMDVAPEHCATSTAMVNTGFATAGAISPLVVGSLLDMTGNWDEVFLLTIIVLLIGSLVIFRVRIRQQDSEPQPKFRSVT
jgi:sugar phosphate permease